MLRRVPYFLTSFMHVSVCEALSYVIEKHFGAKIICIKSCHVAELSVNGVSADVAADAFTAAKVVKKRQFANFLPDFA